jgi:hypothetical protein
VKTNAVVTSATVSGSDGNLYSSCLFYLVAARTGPAVLRKVSSLATRWLGCFSLIPAARAVTGIPLSDDSVDIQWQKSASRWQRAGIGVRVAVVVT